MNQHTIKSACIFKGKGLHGGLPVTMTVEPAAPGTGIVFYRTDLGGACDAGLAGHNGMLPYLDIVGYHTEIVYLDSVVNDGRTHRRTVHSRTGAYLDIIAYQNVASLGNLGVTAFSIRCKTESVRTDDGICVQDATFADYAAGINLDARIKDAVASDFNIFADIYHRVNAGAASDARRAGNMAVGKQSGAETVASAIAALKLLEPGQKVGHRRIGIIYANESGGDSLFRLEIPVDQDNIRLAGIDIMLVFGIGEETDGAGAAALDACGSRNGDIRIAGYLAAVESH